MESAEASEPRVLREGNRITLPGLATTHSHAFQRALRGRTQRHSTSAHSFWSWRGLMYNLALKLTPESIYDISRYAFVELATCGVTNVGEFHYIHHQADGTPYDDRLLLSHAVIRAALDAGLRITLLRTLYQRAGAGLPPEPGQLRFSDANVDLALNDLAELESAYRNEPRVRVGVAPHSVRAVTKEALEATASFARKRSMPVHAHVCEQRREIAECIAEYGRRPVELLSELGLINERFLSVHATHLEPHEAKLLAGSFACISRSTERDLGDGLPNLRALRDAGVRVTIGTDSHASSDPFEEARAMELDERSRTESRHAAFDAHALLRALTVDGYAALGWSRPEVLGDRVVLAADDPAIDVLGDDDLEEVVLWSASSRAVREVHVGGECIVKDGRHRDYEAARSAYERALRLALT